MRLRRMIPGALLLFACAGCGLPQFIVLEPPLAVLVDQLGAGVGFSHNADNDPDSFAGYEVYYRFYAPSTVEAEFAADRAAVNAAAPGSAINILAQRGFRRVQGEGQGTQPPLIRVAPADRGLEFAVEIVFPNSTAQLQPAFAQWPANEIGATSVTLQRSITPAKRFQPDLYGTDPGARDPDIPGPDGDYDTEIPMAVVLLSYGVDFTTFQPIYSPPVIVDQYLRLSLTN